MIRLNAFLSTLGLTVLALTLASAGCDRGQAADTAEPNDEGDAPIKIVTTTGMVTDLVRNVAGDRAEVLGLIDAGVDPHLYSPTRSDTQRLLDADIIFYNGLLLEGKLTGSLDRAAEAGKPVHAVTELIGPGVLLASDEAAGAQDPHVWMNPAAWARTVDVVRDALIELDPTGEQIYRDNAEAYAAEINELNEYAARVLATVPEGGRVLVTAHDAFNYFGERFGYEVVGIQGLSTESEAGVRDIEELVELIVRREVGAVFVESTVSDRNINALIDGARDRGHQVAIGGELYSDAMGEAGTYEGTYIGMIDHNVTTIARALGGDAPAGGMRGRLGERSAAGIGGTR